MAFSNPITGGQGALVRPAIKSPNYVAGVSGWSINKNGSAEFNNIVIRGGTVISGTALYYNGTPALGNLFVSISATAGTDSFGNAYVKGVGLYGAAGTLTAKDSAGNQAFISGSLPVNGLLASLPGMYMQPVSNTGDAASIGALNPGGGGDLGLILTSPSPNTGGTPGTDFAQIFLTGPYSSSNTEITMAATITNIDTITIQNGDIQILQGDQINIGSSGSTAAFASKGSVTTDDLLSARINGDNTNSRFVINHAGEMLWGAGGGSAVDVRLYRSAANTLKTDDNLVVAQDVTANNIQSGTFNITPTVAGQWTNNVAVVFPNAFANTPVVMVTASAGGPGTGSTTDLQWQTTGTSTTGFNCRILRGNTTQTTLSWLAVST